VKEWVQRYAERIDNASMRERVLIFIAAALVLVFVANALMIQPLRAKQRSLGGEIARMETELRNVQSGLQRILTTQGADPDARNRARVVELRAELESLTQSIAQEQRRFTPPQRMREILKEMLERDRRLKVLDLKTLPVAEISAMRGQSTRRVFRHGVEVTLAGRYLDLYAYLQALESLPSQLYWGRAELAVAEYPVTTLKLTVYTLSLEQAWLIV
jgi:MSHA biogenesis protein MshJ